MFIRVVFILGSDKLVSCFFYCLSPGISHGIRLLARGRVDDFLFFIVPGEGGGFVIFQIFESILFFVNWISLCFFHR